MHRTIVSLTHLTDTELLSAVTRAAAEERMAISRLIAVLAELDARRLYLGEGCSSLFAYCTRVLRLSEHAAYGRIEAARTVRRFPVVLDLLAEGAVTLTTIGLLAPHLTSENADGLLTASRNQSRRGVEHLVAALRPLPPVPSSVRKLPTTPAKDMLSHSAAPPATATLATQAGEGVAPRRDVSEVAVPGPSPAARPAPVRPAAVTPLSPQRYKVQFTMSREAYETLLRAQDLLRHVIPTADPAAIFERALALLVADLERTRLASTTHPRKARAGRSGSRHVPAAVKRQVWARDGNQCAFVGRQGRCSERGGLEIHHVVPFADGGPTVADNLSVRCKSHNSYEAEQWFGPLLVREERSWYSIDSVRTEDVRNNSHSRRSSGTVPRKSSSTVRSIAISFSGPELTVHPDRTSGAQKRRGRAPRRTLPSCLTA
jgi:hypothetical protein